MLKEERLSHILTLIKKKGKANYESLAGELNVSEDTIRRDIESLHHNGLLLKVRGGAISLSKNPLSFQDRTRYQSAEKNIIAIKTLQLIREGQTVFMHSACINCHTISGTVATGRFGPDLTHLASRDTIASGPIENTPENLRKWIEDPNTMKPGSLMPAMHLTDTQNEQITAYLLTLK